MVNTLQKLCERRIEKLVRKTTCQEKDPVTRSLVSLTEEQLDTATRIAEWVELMPVNVASDMFDRVLGYDGDDDRCAMRNENTLITMSVILIVSGR